MKDGRSNRNRSDRGLEDKVNTLLHKFDIKREVFFGGKVNGVNCRRLMKYYVDIINDINETYIEISKGEVSDVEISKVTNKCKKLLKEMNDMMIFLLIKHEFIFKTQ